MLVTSGGRFPSSSAVSGLHKPSYVHHAKLGTLWTLKLEGFSHTMFELDRTLELVHDLLGAGKCWVPSLNQRDNTCQFSHALGEDKFMAILQYS